MIGSHDLIRKKIMLHTGQTNGQNGLVLKVLESTVSQIGTSWDLNAVCAISLEGCQG